jgi:UDP-N-acetylglucosamine 3-dehydrogenase
LLESLKIGVVGAGYASHLRCNAINKTANHWLGLKGIFDKNEKNAGEFASEFSVKNYNSLEEMLEDEKINTILICTPNKYHYPIAKTALNKGKNIITEYPLAVTEYPEAEELIATSKSKGLFIHVGQTMNFDSDMTLIKANLDKLGRLLMGYKYMSFGRLGSWFDKNSSYDAIGSWYVEDKESGSWFVTSHYHGIQIFRNIFGEVKSVYAIDSSIKGVRSGTITLKHASGASSSIQWGMPLMGDDFNITLISGADGSVEVNKSLYRIQSGDFKEEGNFEEKDTFVNDTLSLIDKLEGKLDFDRENKDMLISLKVSFMAEKASKENRVIEL